MTQMTSREIRKLLNDGVPSTVIAIMKYKRLLQYMKTLEFIKWVVNPEKNHDNMPIIGADSCALCMVYSIKNRGCTTCPLFKTVGFRCNEGDSAWGRVATAIKGISESSYILIRLAYVPFLIIAVKRFIRILEKTKNETIIDHESHVKMENGRE